MGGGQPTKVQFFSYVQRGLRLLTVRFSSTTPDPHLVGGGGRELAQQPVFGHGGHDGTRALRTGAQHPQSASVQPRAQRVAHGMAFGSQFGPQAEGVVAPGVARKRLLGRNLPRNRRGLNTAPPLVIPRAARAQHVAKHVHGLRFGAVPDEVVAAHD